MTSIFNTVQEENPANILQAASGIIDFSFENLDVGVIQHPPRVTNLQPLSGITEFDFEDLAVGAIQHPPRATDFNYTDESQHPPRATSFHIDYLDNSIQCPSRVIDFQFENLGGCQFENLDV